jgi:transcriptional regulator with XRE-family HTH domain
MPGRHPGEESIGELIARQREWLGKSQYALAEALRQACDRGDGAPDRSMVARWENGRRIPAPSVVSCTWLRPKRPR